MRLRVLLFLLSGLLAGALGALLAVAGNGGRPSVRQELARAEQQWSARLAPSYRIVIQQQTRAGVCEQDLEVRDERVRTVYRNQCNQPPIWTVSRLFGWVEQLERPASVCYPSAGQCTCRVSARARVTFDPQLGYPRHISYEWGLRPHWENPHYWQALLLDDDLARCANRARGGGTVEVSVVSLTFLP